MLKSRRNRKCDEDEKEDLEVLLPMNDWYWIALDYRAYCLSEKSLIYDEQVVKHVSKCASRLQVQMKLQQFDPINSMSVIGFFIGIQNCIQQLDNYAIHEGAAMWLVTHFMKRVAVGELTARLSLKPKSSKRKTKESVLTMYGQVINHLLEMYATNDVIAECDKNIFSFAQSTSSTPVQFVDALRMQIWCVLQIYDESLVEGTFI